MKTENNTPGAIIYTRVSSDGQIGGTSLASQRDMCSQYAERNGLKIVSVFEDAGKSGTSTKGRDALAAAIALAQDTGAALIMYKFDRLARNTVDSNTMRDILLGKGCRLISVTEGEATQTPMGRAFYGMLAVFAELERDTLVERMALGRKRRVEQGGWVGSAPYGFTIGRNAERIPILLPIPDKAKTIARVFTDCAFGKIRKRADAVRALMDGLGVSSSTAAKIIRNRVYCGFVSNKITNGREIKAAFDGIVNREVWDTAYARIEKQRQVKLKINPAFPLRGKIKCPQCGKALTAGFSCVKRFGQKYGYYFCPGHYSIRAEKAHAS